MNNKTNIKIIAGLVCVFAVCLAAVFIMFSSLADSYKESVAVESAGHLQEITREVRLYIEETLRSDRSLVRSLAVDISEQKFADEAGLLRFLAGHRKNWNIAHIYIYNSKGFCLDETGRQKPHSLSIKDLYDTVERGESLQIDDTQAEYSAIVKSSTQLRGSPIVVISVVRYLSTMVDQMGFSAFGGAGSVYLTHQNGIKISQSNGASAQNVYNAAALFKPSYLVNLTHHGVTLEKAMREASEQAFLYSDPQGGPPRYLILSPVKAPGETWFLFYSVPSAVVDGNVNSFSRRVGILTLSVAALMLLLFVLFVMAYVERSRRYGEELKMRDRFVELLMSETDNVFLLISSQQPKPLYISSNAASVLGEKSLSVRPRGEGFCFGAPDGGRESATVRVINQELEKWDGRSVFASEYVPYEIAGARNYLVMHLYPVEGREHEYLGIAQNVTRERRREEELKNALAMADSANQAKTSFLANMSHDIRTPLNAIVSMARFAEDDLDDKGKLRQHIGVIQRSSEHLLHLINDVLDMSRIESGKLIFSQDSFDLRETLTSIREIIEPLCEAKQQTFSFDCGGGRSHIRGDSLRLSQILINILNNAVKFTDSGGTVSFKAEELSSLKPELASYRFTVKDNGIGIAPDKIEQIFEPFVRVDEESVRRTEGTGLGLAITRRFIEAMGGNIKVRSSLGSGSEFTVEMPFAVDESQASDQKQTALAVQPGSFKGRRALLVEDNDINRYIARTILKKWGFEVEEATDGRKAVERFKASAPGSYDIIFMDIQMPVMNGYDAAVAIRRLVRADSASVSIVAMTANVFAEDVERARQSGMNAHVGKPIDPDLLRAVVAKLLTERHDQDETR